MNSYRVSPWIFGVMFLSIWNVEIQGQSKYFAVTDFGAVADGKTDNKLAFANAWKNACDSESGVVSVPKGTFFVSGGDFEGPCNGPTLFKIDGTVIASPYFVAGLDFWLSFSRVDSLTLSGYGLLDGNGASSWSRCKLLARCNRRPVMLKIFSVTNAVIQGINLANSKMFHLHIHESQNVTVNSVHISAPADSPNTDGIHIGRSKTVHIANSSIATGDDCISMGDGSQNVNITGIRCGPGHGISIGSLGRYAAEQDVTGITVRNCTLSKTQNGLRIKTLAPSLSSSVVSDITFSDIIVDGTDNPIIIDQHYCPSGSCRHGEESSVLIKGVRYVNVRGSSSTATAVSIECSKSKGCHDVELVGLDITYDGKPTTAVCSSVDARFQGTGQVPSRCF